MATNNYIVRQPIKNTKRQVIGHEILYYGENELYGGMGDGAVNEFAVADAIYNFLTQNSEKALKGSLNFMTFTTTLLMKKVPRLFDPPDLVIQIDDSVIIHPLAMHFVQMYQKEGYRIAVNEFQFAPRYLDILDSIDYLRLNTTRPCTISSKSPGVSENTVSPPKSTATNSIRRPSVPGFTPWKAPPSPNASPPKPTGAVIYRAVSSASW